MPKRAANASVRAELRHAARAAKRKQWREQNQDAIRAYNDHVEKHGMFSDDVRTF
jgi:antitoxin CcdA